MSGEGETEAVASDERLGGGYGGMEQGTDDGGASADFGFEEIGESCLAVILRNFRKLARLKLSCDAGDVEFPVILGSVECEGSIGGMVDFNACFSELQERGDVICAGEGKGGGERRRDVGEDVPRGGDHRRPPLHEGNDAFLDEPLYMVIDAFQQGTRCEWHMRIDGEASLSDPGHRIRVAAQEILQCDPKRQSIDIAAVGKQVERSTAARFVPQIDDMNLEANSAGMDDVDGGFHRRILTAEFPPAVPREGVAERCSYRV